MQNTPNDDAAQLARLQVAQATDLDLVEKLEAGWIKVRTGQADDTLATIDIFRRACERRQLVIDGIKSRQT